MRKFYFNNISKLKIKKRIFPQKENLFITKNPITEMTFFCPLKICNRKCH